LEEVWRLVTIDDYGDKYSVSSLGRIRNNDTWEILKPHEIKGGYLRVNLYPRGNAKHGGRRRLVHRLVAFAFLADTYVEGVTTDVNHIDGNKHNNSVSNLEWCTRKHNIQHAEKMGLYDEHRKRLKERFSGEGNPMYGKGDRQLGANNPRARAVICLNTKQVFDTITLAKQWCGSDCGITEVCKGKYKTAGNHPITGERLSWMFYDDYLKIKNEENDN
jgi:hypothetical protein